jgi:hypothetical protein
MNTTPKEGTVCRCGDAYLTLVRWDADTSPEAWSFCAVLAVQGPLPTDGEAIDESEIMFAVGNLGINVSAQCDGHRFARNPWLDYFGRLPGGEYRTIILRQSGGLDV